LKQAQAAVDARDRGLAEGQVSAHDLQTKLDDATAQNEQLRVELERLGKNADALLAEKGTLANALAEAKARLEELRKAQAAADARTALFRQLALRFQKMIDSGQLKVKLREGRMVIELANDVLFDSGQTVVKPEGQKAIGQVAAVLRTIAGRRFQVAGHTDNVAITTARFRSNWDLSAARAVEVVRILIAQGLKPELVSAAGYGEFDPIAPNDTPQSKGKNRRIEITLQPNIDELVAVPEAK
jgi:chemotaxis protein MotB